MVPSLRYVLFVVLFHYTINNDYTWYYICSAWFLDIIISTCFCRWWVCSQIIKRIFHLIYLLQRIWYITVCWHCGPISWPSWLMLVVQERLMLGVQERWSISGTSTVTCGYFSNLINIMHLFNHMCAGQRHVHAWFLIIAFALEVGMRVHVCVSLTQG